MVHKYVCFIVIFEKQGGYGPQVEAGGAQDHLSYHGRSTLETGVTVDKDAISESKNDTDQEDQQTPKHTRTSRHKAGCITSQGTGPGHWTSTELMKEKAVAVMAWFQVGPWSKS